MRHTVVLSDLHLWDALPDDGLWMRYRHRRFFPDEELASLLELLTAEVAATRGALELVFAGDIFDFDVPASDGTMHSTDTPAAAALRMGEILAEHPVFLHAVARVLLEGHRVVFLGGNHDPQINWTEVQDVLANHLLDAALFLDASIAPALLRSRLLFRSWFHRTPDGVHVEHGNQYDRYCSFQNPVDPFGADGRSVEPTAGSLLMRHMIGRLGYMNPNVDSTFLLSLPQYARHWWDYYLFSQRSIAATWVLGSLRTARDMLHGRTAREPRRESRTLREYAWELEADPEAVLAHARLFSPMAVPEVLRVLQFDRAMLVAAGVVSASLALASTPLALAAMAGSVGAFGAFGAIVPYGELDDVYEHVAKCSREIARLHRAKAVVMGHTHKPFGRWEQGVFYGNSGSWSPLFTDVACTKAVEDSRPALWLRSDDDGNLSGGLYRYRRGLLVPADAVPAHTNEGRRPSLLPGPAGAV